MTILKPPTKPISHINSIVTALLVEAKDVGVDVVAVVDPEEETRTGTVMTTTEAVGGAEAAAAEVEAAPAEIMATGERGAVVVATIRAAAAAEA